MPLKHICVMSEFFPPYVGGGQIHALEIIKNLKGTYRFDIITNALDGLPSSESSEGFIIHRVGVSGKVDSFSRRLKYIRAAKRLALQLHEKDPFDLIHAHVFAGSLAGYYFGKKANLLIINTVHGVYLHDPDTGFLKRILQKYVVKRKYSKTIAVSQITKGQLLELGVDPDSIQVIYNGVDPSLFENQHDHQGDVFTVVYVGRLWRIKGIHLLVEAAASIVKERNDVRFLLVGDGPERQELEAKIVRNNLSNFVTITGFQDYAKIPGILKEADLFVLPSLMEGMPNSILEAMAARVPVVATKVGGVPEIVTHMQNGILIEPNSVEQLANAIITVIDDADLRNRLAEAGHKMINERFKWSDTAAQVSQLYEKVMDSHRS